MNDPVAQVIMPVAVTVVDDEIPFLLPRTAPLVVDMFPFAVDMFPYEVIFPFVICSQLMRLFHALSCCHLLIPQIADSKYLRQFAIQQRSRLEPRPYI